jgi:hypothetical protein
MCHDGGRLLMVPHHLFFFVYVLSLIQSLQRIMVIDRSHIIDQLNSSNLKKHKIIAKHIKKIHVPYMD